MNRATDRPISIAPARRAKVLAGVVLAAAGALLWAPAPGRAAVSPAAYRVSRICGRPSPGYSACLGLRLVARQPAGQPGVRVTNAAGAAGAAGVTGAAGAAGAQGEATSTSSPANPSDGEAALKKVEHTEPVAGSFEPGEIADAYGLAGLPAPAKTQTLALVDAYNDPTIEHDLDVFDEQYRVYGVPECTPENGCFTKVECTKENTKENKCFRKAEMKGKGPPEEPGWAQEISTDVELAHSVCPACKIMLVEAYSSSDANLEVAEREAERLGATEISNSWGGTEPIDTAEDESRPFNHPGTVITAAAGDEGYLNWEAAEAFEVGEPDYPASSPHVVAVGGTRLQATGGKWEQETVWNGYGASGGGCSPTLEAQPWQLELPDWQAVGCGSHRAVADVSADADPYTGVSVYDSTPVIEGRTEYKGWAMIGGTSVATPIIAAAYALAGGAGSEPGGGTVAYPAKTLYENLAFDPASLHDVTEGSNGECTKGFVEEGPRAGLSECSIAEEGASCNQQTICVAGPGYDGPSGVGTPDGIAAFLPLSAAERTQLAERERAEREASERGALQVGPAPTPQNTGGAGTGSGGTTADAHSPKPVAVLSGLSLTRGTTAALARSHAQASELAFAFTLSSAAHVRVTLAEQVTVHRRRRWQTLPYTLTIAAGKGRDTARLRAHRHLRPGVYRLTLTPAGGVSRTLVFRVG